MYSILFRYLWIIVAVLWLVILVLDIWRNRESLITKTTPAVLCITKKYWFYIILGFVLVIGIKPRNIDEQEMKLLDNYKVFLNQRGHFTNDGAVSESNKSAQPVPSPTAPPKTGVNNRE